MKIERKIVAHGEVATYTISKDCNGSWQLEIENFGESVTMGFNRINSVIDELTELTTLLDLRK